MKIYNPLLLLSMLLLTTACTEKVSQANQIPPKFVKTQQVKQTQFLTKHYDGKVEAMQTVDLTFRLNGELTSLNVKAGQQVNKGDVIATLDDTLWVIAKKAEQAKLNKAKAELARAKSLKNSGSISDAELDNLQAQFLSSEAALEKAEDDLKHTKLVSPFDGIITNRFVDNFNNVSSSTPVVRLQNLSQLLILIALPENVVRQMNQNVTPEINAIFSGSDNKFPLQRYEFNVSGNESGQYEGKLVMDNPKTTRVLPGMSVKVEVKVPDMRHQVVLPSHSVLEDDKGNYVFIATGGQTKTAQRRYVTVGGVQASGVVITQGLKKGEHVIVAGVSQVFDGQAVKLLQE